jgi:hypothetical protein
MRTQKPHALLRNLRKLQQAHHLKSIRPSAAQSISSLEKETNQPTTISQDIVTPSLQPMRPTNLIQDFLARLQAEMICIIET